MEIINMKEKLYTIPLNDAVNENDECPFCFIERKLEQDMINFVLGSSSSYMESDIREQTDKIGFCRTHMKKMFDYGNTLGNSLILKTHYQKLQKEFQEQIKHFTPGKVSLADRLRKQSSGNNSIAAWAAQKDCSCYVCNGLQENFDRYMETFFYMYTKDSAFHDKIVNGKGFCLHHFGLLCENADRYLNEKQKAAFYPEVFALMEQNLHRLEEDISWLIDKFDYRNKDADWKTSKDALQRSMQKLRGGYPADPVFKAQ